MIDKNKLYKFSYQTISGNLDMAWFDGELLGLGDSIRNMLEMDLSEFFGLVLETILSNSISDCYLSNFVSTFIEYMENEFENQPKAFIIARIAEFETFLLQPYISAWKNYLDFYLRLFLKPLDYSSNYKEEYTRTPNITYTKKGSDSTTDTTNRDSSTATNLETTNNGARNDKTFGFNSVSGEGVDKDNTTTNSTETLVGSKNDNTTNTRENSSGSTTYNTTNQECGTETITRSGYKDITQTKMVKEFIDFLSTTDFYDMLVRDVKKAICLDIYD